jgi:hypothetical protein
MNTQSTHHRFPHALLTALFETASSLQGTTCDAVNHQQ